MAAVWSRRYSCVTSCLALIASGVVGLSPAASAEVDGSNAATVRLVVEHVAQTSTAELVAAASDRAQVRAAQGISEIDSSTLDVAASQVAAAAAELRAVNGVTSVRIDARARASGFTPNDPYWPNQATLRSVGLPDAWTRSTGLTSTVIAILDTGVDPSPDLGARLMTGYDFVNDDTNTSDDNGHGSDVASVAAAAGNDNATLAGVCWQCRVLPVKVLGADGSGYMSDVASGIVWATNAGANVISLSLGSPSSDSNVANAVAYAAARDVIVVAAAGNDGSTNHSYPAADSSVVSVGANDPSGALYPWSQRGSGWVDVAAPGCNVADGGGVVGTFCGTSSATPVVAGTLGLLRSMNPTASRSVVVDALTSTSSPLTTSGQVAYGRINADAAAAALPAQPGITSTPTEPDTTAPTVWIEANPGLKTGTVSTTVHASDPSGIAKVILSSGATVLGEGVPGADGVALIDWDPARFGDAVVALNAEAVDGAGNHGSATGTVSVDFIAPRVGVWAPVAGRTVTGRFTAGIAATDGNGIQVVLVIANGRWIVGYAGGAARTVTFTPWANGRFQVVAVTVDNAGRAAFSNVVNVNVRLKRGARRR